MMWASANGWLRFVTFYASPVWFIALFILMAIWNDCHFYWIRPLIHWKPLYRAARYLHHRNVNVGPSSGLAMHPIEHVLYFTRWLILLSYRWLPVVPGRTRGPRPSQRGPWRCRAVRSPSAGQEPRVGGAVDLHRRRAAGIPRDEEGALGQGVGRPVGVLAVHLAVIVALHRLQKPAEQRVEPDGDDCAALIRFSSRVTTSGMATPCDSRSAKSC